MSTRAQEIAALHAEYQRLTGIPVTLMGREWVWWEWLKRGLTIDDLRLLVADMRRRIRAGELSEYSLAFRNLAGNVDRAEEDILMLRSKAHAQARAPRIDPARTEALRATGRPAAAPSQPARDAGAIAAQLTRDPAAAAAALEEFKRLKTHLRP